MQITWSFQWFCHCHSFDSLLNMSSRVQAKPGWPAVLSFFLATVGMPLLQPPCDIDIPGTTATLGLPILRLLLLSNLGVIGDPGNDEFGVLPWSPPEKYKG
jgi:hypothetical protein